jgi:hypothetical protein
MVLTVKCVVCKMHELWRERPEKGKREPDYETTKPQTTLFIFMYRSWLESLLGNYIPAGAEMIRLVCSQCGGTQCSDGPGRLDMSSWFYCPGLHGACVPWF